MGWLRAPSVTCRPEPPFHWPVASYHLLILGQWGIAQVRMKGERVCNVRRPLFGQCEARETFHDKAEVWRWWELMAGSGGRDNGGNRPLEEHDTVLRT